MMNEFFEYLRINYYHEEFYSAYISNKITSFFSQLNDYEDAINFFYNHELEFKKKYESHVNTNYDNDQRFSYFLSIWFNAYQNNRKFTSQDLASKIMGRTM